MFPIENSDYYHFYLLEREEIMKLKWIESEKAGYDIGMNHAFWIWNMQHRQKWLKEIEKKTG